MRIEKGKEERKRNENVYLLVRPFEMNKDSKTSGRIDSILTR